MRVARCATRQLRIRSQGCFQITFLGAQKMRSLNRRFLGHDHLTDVLSFRYENEPIVGELLIAPQAAWLYAREHGLEYSEELARYVIHGLLHWMGYEDRSANERKRLRALENRLLKVCTARSQG